MREKARFCDKCGFPLGDKEADLTFGRSSDCTVQLTSSQVSRRHARAVLVSGVWFLRDEGSTNGTFLNEQRLSAPKQPSQWRPVSIGATVRFADVEIRLTKQGFVDASGKIIWQPLPAVHCPFCSTRLPKALLIAFCPSCGHSLRWLEIPPSPLEFFVSLERKEPVSLELRFSGISQEPLSVQVKSQRPDLFLLDVDGFPSAEGRWSGQAGGTLHVSLLPQLSMGITQPCEGTLLIRSIFAPQDLGSIRSVWHPKELETERAVIVRLVPVFVHLTLTPPVLLLSERHHTQSVRLVNQSPIAIQGTVVVPEEIFVQPERWQLQTGAELSFKVEARKRWDNTRPVCLIAQPDNGEPVRCDVYWVGGKEGGVREPDIVVGVDFGTSKSAVAYRDYRQAEEKVKLMQLQGRDWLPSALVFLVRRKEPLLGREAEARLGDPEALPVQGVKLLLRSEQTIAWEGQTWTPTRLAQRFLRFLREQVEACLGDEAVCLKRYELGLPILDDPQRYEEQRSISLKAAGEAGMGWVRAWWEPICAAVFVLYRWQAFAKNLPSPRPEDLVLVLDWGAGTMEAAVLSYERHQPPFFGLPPLVGVGLEKGGNFLDWRLTCDFLREAGLTELFQDAQKLGFKEFRWRGSLALRQLAEAIREAKEGLGQATRPAKRTVGDFRSFLTEPVFADLRSDLPLVTSEMLNYYAREVLNEMKTQLDTQMREVNWHDIDYAFIVGGSGQIPIVKDIVSDWIGKPNRVVQLKGRDAILAVAFGAAVLSEVQIQNAVPFRLILRVNGEEEELLRTGDILTHPIARRFSVPLGKLTVAAFIAIGEQRYPIATVSFTEASVRVQISVDNEGWLCWNWTDAQTQKVLNEQRLVPLP